MLIMCNDLMAQQDAQFTQYMYNTITVNPAYAGSRNALSFNAIHRSQWVGLEGAPNTQTFSVNSPVGPRVGLGMSVVRDEIGPSVESNVAVDFSYTLPVNDDDLNFAFGLKAGVHLLDVDFRKLDTYNPLDNLLQENINKVSPQIGLGAYLYDKKWYVGLSTPNVLSTEHYDEVSSSTASERLHIFVIGGYVFDLNQKIKFKPAVLFKLVSGAPIGTDISANFLFNEKFTLGASYRLDAAVSALAGFQVTEKIMLGYAYDFDTTELARYNSGSHEFFLRFELSTKTKNKVSPRFF